MAAAGAAAPGDDALLGVAHSLAGKRWQTRLTDSRLGLALAQQLDCPELVGRVLAGRGVTPGDAERFLSPSLRAELPDPSGFKDMDRAVARLQRALAGGEPIAVFADYDVDGACSAALLARFLRAVGAEPRVYVPDRLSEGYGPNRAALKHLQAEGTRVVVCVDCGTTAFDALEAAAGRGLDVIVVDHHEAEPRLPPAAAVVNPNRLDADSGCGELAAVGVTFLLVVALNRALRAAGRYAGARGEPDLLAWLDLVALGTVCDVAPLTGLNRALVAQGLKVLARRGNVGLAALADAARLDERPTAYHLGFVLGPRINAGGRVGEAGLGARLLTGEDAGEAARLAARLEACNDERRELEASVLEAALAEAEGEAGGGGDGPLVFAAGPGWHPGVLGIVASRLQERYDRPAVVIGLDDAGTGKGSGRSVPGVDLGSAVIAARQAGLLREGGGHAMAAGLTVDAARLAELRAFLAERIGRALAGAAAQPALRIDGLIQPGAATAELVQALERLAPYGVGNPEPRFAVPNAQVVRAEVVGRDHVRCILTGADGRRLKAIAFRAADGPLGRGLMNARGQSLHLAGRLRLDAWAGRDAVQMIVEDAAPA